MFDDHYGYGMVHASSGPDPVQFVVMIVILALIALGVVFLIRRMSEHGAHRHGHQSSALDALNLRYAKGEITRAEYEVVKADILTEPKLEVPIEVETEKAAK